MPGSDRLRRSYINDRYSGGDAVSDCSDCEYAGLMQTQITCLEAENKRLIEVLSAINDLLHTKIVVESIEND